MRSTLDESIRSAIVAIVADSPELGPVPTDGDVRLRPTFEQPRPPRRRLALVAVILVVTAAFAMVALALWRDSGDKSVPLQEPSVVNRATEPAAINSVSRGFLSVPTMDGGAFVADGRNLTVGIAVHDPSTALPEDATNDVSVIYVGREQFGPLEDLVTGDEIYWKPTGASTELRFRVTGVHSYAAAIDPATTATSGLIVVIDPANPKSGQRIVVSAIQATDPAITEPTAQ